MFRIRAMRSRVAALVHRTSAFTVHLVTEDGQSIRVSVPSPSSNLLELKHNICRTLCVPVDQLVLFKGENELNDGDTVGQLTRNGDTVGQLTRNGSPRIRLVVKHTGPGGAVLTLGLMPLEPMLDADNTNSVDDGSRYVRSGLAYKPALGWHAYGLNYNRCLRSGSPSNCFTGDKAISYSPVHPSQVATVCKGGYINPEACFPECPFSGIISTFDPTAAARMATVFSSGNKKYKVLVENRMLRDSVSIIQSEDPLVGAVYVTKLAEDIWPFAILVKEVEI